MKMEKEVEKVAETAAGTVRSAIRQAYEIGRMEEREAYNFMDAVCVWTMMDAPPVYKSMSRHGGDEELVFLVPFEVVPEEPNGELTEQYNLIGELAAVIGLDAARKADEMRVYSRGLGFVDVHKTADGWVVITAHA